MFFNRTHEPNLAARPGIPAWRVLPWLALTLYLFNAWAIGWYKWTDVLLYEVPSRAALTRGHLWTVLTYAVTGTGSATRWFFGLLSVVCLFVVAQLVEAELTRRDFFRLCAVCALAGVACWLPWHWANGEQLLSGCTVLVLGLLSFWCFAMPDEPMPMRLFFMLELRPQAFFWLALALETGAFLSFELPKALGHPGAFHANFDNSAQLGGMLAGGAFAYFWRRKILADLAAATAETSPRQQTAVPVGVIRAAEPTSLTRKPTLPSQRELREEVDRILDKINNHGFASLNAQEIQTLDRAKFIFSK